MVLAPRCKSPRTPTKSIIRPLEAGGVSPGALEELSLQIESLIERGRRLRELKNTMRRSPPSNQLGDTRVSVLETSIDQRNITEPLSAFDEVLAAVNASDPLFCEQPRDPVVPIEPIERVSKHLRLPTRPPCVRKSEASEEFEYRVDSLSLTIAPRSDAIVRLRTFEGTGEMVKGSASCEVAVEVWRKKSNELAAMGRLSRKNKSSGEIFEVECFDIWNGEIVGVVTVSVKKNPSAPEIVLESLVESGKTSVQREYTFKREESLDDFLVQRSITRRKPLTMVSSGVIASAPVSECQVPPLPPLYPNEIEEESDYEEPHSEFFSDLLKRASTFADSVTCEIEKSADPHSVLKKRMMELDALTHKLNGTVSSEDQSPITHIDPPPDVTQLEPPQDVTECEPPQEAGTSRVTLGAFRRRRRRKLRGYRINGEKKTLSLVTAPGISIEGPSSSNRRPISALRQSAVL